jgi:hypothetical protein
MIPIAGGPFFVIGMPEFNLTHRSDEKRIIDLPGIDFCSRLAPMNQIIKKPQ